MRLEEGGAQVLWCDAMRATALLTSETDRLTYVLSGRGSRVMRTYIHTYVVL